MTSLTQSITPKLSSWQSKLEPSSSFQLFEALAEAIAAAIFDQFEIEEVRIAVKKLSPPIEPTLSYAGVEIHRKRKSDG